MPSEEEIKAAAWAICHAQERDEDTAAQYAKVALEAAEKVRTKAKGEILKLRMPPSGHCGRMSIDGNLRRYRFEDGHQLVIKDRLSFGEVMGSLEVNRLFLLEGQHQWLKLMPFIEWSNLGSCNAEKQAVLWHRAIEGEPWELNQEGRKDAE